MTDRKNPPKNELRHTGDDAISPLTFAELMGLPDVPDHTAVQMFLSGIDLGDELAFFHRRVEINQHFGHEARDLAANLN